MDRDVRANLTGSAWMVAAMAGFAVEDVMIKSAAQVLPAGQILILFGLGGALVFASVTLLNREPLFTRDVVGPAMLIRLLFEITARVFYTLAIALSSLSAATVILQTTPLVVVAGAAVLFGERVGWRRWTAILAGLAGVVIILRPGTESFSALSILAVIGMIGFAGRDLASRIAPAALQTSILGLYGFLAVTIGGVLVSLWQGAGFVAPGLSIWLYLAGSVAAGVCAYACLMKAMRTGEVSAVTPFRYTRLLFGVACGVLLFGEEMSAAMLTGSALIIASGLFILTSNRWRVR